MELNYFISGSQAASISQKDKWLDSSSLASRSFTTGTSYTLTGISGYSDFSLFFTFDKKDNKSGSLLSNIHSTSPRGFSLNFNNNNELFLYSNFKDSDCYTFYDVRLGKKNCLAVIKAGQQISILNYDLDSKTVYKEESFSFADTSNISGGNFLIGYNPIVNSRISLSGISGIFDQLVCFNMALEEGDYNSIFSGFLPLQGSYTTTYTKYYEYKQIEVKEGSILSNSNASKLVPFLDYVSSSSVPLTAGNYIANITGVANSGQSKVYWSGYYGFSEDLLCYYTGTLTAIGGEYTPYSPAAFNGNLYFDNEVYYSMNDNAERTSSHLFSFYTNNPNLEDFFTYNKIEKYKDVTTATLVDSATANDYKKTFYMNGIVANNSSYCNLFYYPNQSYTGVGRELIFDKSKGLFSLDGYFKSGNNIYWGLSGKISSYNLSNTHIDFTDFVEDNSYPLIYDMLNIESTKLFAAANFSTGNFQRGAPVVFFGNILRAEYRQRREEFTETSSYHIAHSKRNMITLDNASGIYNESTNDYWKLSMRTLDPPAPIV
jgi:hypothetical protein